MHANKQCTQGKYIIADRVSVGCLCSRIIVNVTKYKNLHIHSKYMQCTEHDPFKSYNCIYSIAQCSCINTRNTWAGER